ncbi:hypothetical protein II582_04555 [bacterium]|nr:hypothetical protein [bacterium]
MPSKQAVATTKTTNTAKSSPKLTYEYFESKQTKIAPIVKQLKSNYSANNNFASATNHFDKIQ